MMAVPQPPVAGSSYICRFMQMHSV